MTVTPDILDETIVLVGEHPGVTVIPAGTVLTRLNHFDGMLLRSESLRVEQEYVRTLAALSNVAGGTGIVHGFDTVLQGDGGLLLGPGLAISPSGRPLVLPRQVGLSVAQIVDRSMRAPGPGGGVVGRAPGEGFAECVDIATTPATGRQAVQSVRLWVIAIGAAEALCGHEDVYGKLCEDACSTASDRPYRLEGLVVVALPLRLTVPLAASGAVSLGAIHERSLVASAAFATERAARPDLRSRAGLASETWCLGTRLEGGDDLVPVALVARSGSGVIFLDEWIVRRELMETPPRRYWAPRMGMRPLDVFLAQVLQFQCQLRDGLGGADDPGNPTNPCASQQAALSEALQYLGEIAARLADGGAEALAAGPHVDPALLGGATRLSDVRGKLAAALHQVRGGTGQRILVDRGIVELPPAGFLPVVPGTTTSIDMQVRALMGPGVDLRFCVTRPDVVAHELEEAQHMDRISLLTGLDKPDQRPQVDVLVPDGELVTSDVPARGISFDTTLQLDPRFASLAGKPGAVEQVPSGAAAALHGAARADLTAGGGGAFRFAGIAELAKGASGTELVRGLAGLRPGGGDGAAAIAALPEMSSLDVAQRRADPGFAMRMRALGAEAASGSAERRARPGDAEAQAAAVKLATRTKGDVVALWLDASCEANPFALAAGERTPVQAILDVTAPDKETTVLRAELRGELIVDTDVALLAGGGRSLAGRLHGLGFRSTPGGLPGIMHEGVEVDTPVTLTVRPDATSNTEVELMLRLDAQHDVRIVGVASTAEAGQPPTVKVDVLHGAHNAADTHTSVASAGLREDAGIADPANVAHALSRSALELLGVGLQDPAFASDASHLLFPPDAPPADGAASVRGVRDWVLFHRRRTITCAGATVTAPPAPVAPARFEVYALASPDTSLIDRLATALNSASIGVLGAFALKSIGRVEFAGHTANLETVAAAIQADWRASAPGERIRLAAIGDNAGAAADPALLGQRLQRVLGALTPVTPPAPILQPAILTGVPPALAVDGTDGVIVLASVVVEHKTTCVSVFRLRNSMAGRFQDLFAAGDPTGAIALVSDEDLSLGQLTFAEGGEAIESGLDVAQGLLTGAGLPKALETLAFVWRAGDAVGDEQQLSIGRVTAIAEGLGYRGLALESGPVTAALPGKCPVVAILVPPVAPKTTCMTVFRVPAEGGEAALFMNNLRNDPERALTGALAGGPVKLGVVRFDERGAAILQGGDVDDLHTRWGGFTDDLANVVVFSRADDAAAGEPSLRDARARALAAELGHGDGIVPEVAVRPVAQALPFECPAVAYLLPSLPVQAETCHTVRLVKKTALGRFIKWIDENGELVTVNFLVEDPTFETSHDLGPARFVDHSADVRVDDIASLRAEFAQKQGAPVKSVTVLSMAGDPRVGSETVRRERAQAILALLEIDSDAITLSESATPLPGTCPVITLLVPDVSKIEAGGG
jgi:hypothetical protein